MDKRYTDGQMAAILKRAAELQSSGEEPVHELGTIQDIAQQVGIDPRHVADAAAMAAFQGSGASGRIFGASAAFRRSLQLPEVLSATDRSTVVGIIRDQMPQVGVVTESADRLEWHAGPRDNMTAVTVSSAPGGTLIRADFRHLAPKIGFYSGVAVATLAGGALSAAIWPGLGAGPAVGICALAFATARFLWNRFAHRRQQRLEQLLAILGDQLRQHGPSRGEEAPLP